MALQKKNKQIHIDKHFLATLAFAKGGFLGPVDKFMNEEEAKEVNKSGYYKNSPMPFSFIFAPNGKRNQKNMKKAKKGQIFDLVCENEIVGFLETEGVHKVNKINRVKNIHGIYDESNLKVQKILNAVGEYALSGRFDVNYQRPLQDKRRIEEAIERLNAKKITGLVLGVKPFNRAHERLIRNSLEDADLLVIFLAKPYEIDGLSFGLREKILRYFVEKYLTKDKVIIVPFENTYVFSDSNITLQSIVASNFGCNKFIIGRNHEGIEMYYDHNQPHSSLDRYKNDLPLEIVIAPEYVFCNNCKTLVSTNTCPHGSHHHIKYNGESLKELLLAGILPPALFIRRDISAMMMSELFPDRFKNIQSLYDNLFPNLGLLVEHSEKDFYEELMKLHQTTSMV